MCGIVGIASRYDSADQTDLLRMRETLHHRGPDDAGLWWSADKSVGLAHQRLSILDLSDAGRQPMFDNKGRTALVFNGEIYNYRDLRIELEALGCLFQTGTDTEVIIEAYRVWSTDCLTRLNGMFAFCLYDLNAKTLFLARDRVGKKPLFYSFSNNRFLFASELKALLSDPAFPRTIDAQSFEYYLAYGYVPGERCILKGVNKLAQGQALVIDLDRWESKSWYYWQLPEPDYTSQCSDELLLDELEQLVTDSVRLRLHADVPVGVLLSGGVDSSLITALAAQISSQPVKSFTIVFPGQGKFNEAEQARTVANYFGTEHTELAADDVHLDLLPDLAKQFDEPIADSSMIPTFLVSQLIKSQATVAISGDGGDELFAGYVHYPWLQQISRLRDCTPALLSNTVSTLAAKMLPVGFKARNYLVGLAGELCNSVAHVDMYFDAYARSHLIAPELALYRSALSLSPEDYKKSKYSSKKTPLQNAISIDFMTYLVDDILTKVDRASMLASLEMRSPLLDYRVIEFAYKKVPDRLKASEGGKKVLLRQLARKLLPPELDITRKQGFSIPLSSWLRGSQGQDLKAILHEAPAWLFNKKYIDRLLVNSNKSRINNDKHLFSLIVFELWRRHYNIVEIA